MDPCLRCLKWTENQVFVFFVLAFRGSLDLRRAMLCSLPLYNRLAALGKCRVCRQNTHFLSDSLRESGGKSGGKVS